MAPVTYQLRCICNVCRNDYRPLVSLFTPKPDKELVDSAFACYEKETEVPQKTALGK